MDLLTFCIAFIAILGFAYVSALFLDWITIKYFTSKDKTKKPFDEKP